jgi:very-short-patch-repair endonuclease
MHEYEELKKYAKELRKKSTISEVILWDELKNKKFYGYKFNRQKILLNKYIVDFYCPKIKLIIEIDGKTHENKYMYDKKREEEIKSKNYNIIRFRDIDINNNIEGVLDGLKYFVEKLKA